MTQQEANKLLLMLQYNFPGFYPTDVQGIAVVKSAWMEELSHYDHDPALKAVKKLFQTLTYPPKIADFRKAMGIGTGDAVLTLNDMQARLPYHGEEFKYLEDDVLERKWEKVMAEWDKAVPMQGNSPASWG